MRLPLICLLLIACGDSTPAADGSVDAGLDATADALVDALDGAPEGGLEPDAAVDGSEADGNVGSAVGDLCLEVSARWAPGGSASDDSRECAESAAWVADFCPILPDVCLAYWMCMDENSNCRGGNPDRIPACIPYVDDPAVPDATLYCITGESMAPIPVTGPGDEACRGASGVIGALELECFGAGGGFSDRFCSMMVDDCAGYWNCAAGAAMCDTDLHAVVWDVSCDDLREPSGFDCRRGS